MVLDIEIIENEADKVDIDIVGEIIKVPGEGFASFRLDETLSFQDGVLSVNTTDKVEEDNTRPITSGAVYAEIGNIELLLSIL